MRRILPFLLVLLLAAPDLIWAQPGRLRIGGFVVAPLMQGGSDQPVQGALPEFVRREVEPKLSQPLDWQAPMTFARAWRNLKAGELDILLLVSFPDDPKAGVGRFHWAYLNAAPCLAVRPESPLRQVPRMSALADLRIGWLYGSQIPSEFHGVPIQWQRTSGPQWQAINLRMLRADRLDAAFYGNSFSPAYFARKEGVPIRIVPLPMPAQPFEMAYSLKSDPAMIKEFDRVAGQAFKGDRFRDFLAGYQD